MIRLGALGDGVDPLVIKLGRLGDRVDTLVMEIFTSTNDHMSEVT